MHTSLTQDLARVHMAERLRQAEHARLCRTVPPARAPRRRPAGGWKVQWPSIWFARPLRMA